jgi:hypothetical protein
MVVVASVAANLTLLTNKNDEIRSGFKIRLRRFTNAEENLNATHFLHKDSQKIHWMAGYDVRSGRYVGYPLSAYWLTDCPSTF